jgi:hypothetical protein
MAQDKKQLIDLGLTRVDNTGRTTHGRIRLETGKHYNGGLVSDVHGEWVGDHFVTHAMSIGGPDALGDFAEVLHRTARDVKATQKSIDTQHARVFTSEVVEAVTRRALAHYAAQDAAKAAKLATV